MRVVPGPAGIEVVEDAANHVRSHLELLARVRQGAAWRGPGIGHHEDPVAAARQADPVAHRQGGGVSRITKSANIRSASIICSIASEPISSAGLGGVGRSRARGGSRCQASGSPPPASSPT